MSLRIAKIFASLRQVAPYLAIEIILPGGSLLALILWLMRNRARVRAGLARARSRIRMASQLAAVLRPSTVSTL
ncbi:MAG: hypothetical protein KGO22_10120 [Gammaproteobacteria bacterium]|nr:hypothetical protein [Gammaproteobacteria bacterium]